MSACPGVLDDAFSTGVGAPITLDPSGPLTTGPCEVYRASTGSTGGVTFSPSGSGDVESFTVRYTINAPTAGPAVGGRYMLTPCLPLSVGSVPVDIPYTAIAVTSRSLTVHSAPAGASLLLSQLVSGPFDFSVTTNDDNTPPAGFYDLELFIEFVASPPPVYIQGAAYNAVSAARINILSWSFGCVDAEPEIHYPGQAILL